MPDGHGAATAPLESGDWRSVRHFDWDRAVTNHQSDEKLRAFLIEYPADLHRIVGDMREAFSCNDNERLREAAQQVMGSSSYVAATALHECARSLVEAIDLDMEGVANLAKRTVAEAELLEKEISALDFVREGKIGVADASPLGAAPQQACCVVT
mmetsp:Transcript_29368/g.62490  ORF Transcript_29368/g.62490 Transcript_29368/m.62490 type:complete len:155 (-) Transcript_29368:75-539(-)